MSQECNENQNGSLCGKTPTSVAAKTEGTNHTDEIPYKGGFGLYNIVNLIREGYPQIKRLSTDFGSTVYRIKLNECQTYVTDHKAVELFYDHTQVKKETGFGFLKFNAVMLKGHIPSIFLNGNEHISSKTDLIQYINFVNNNTNLQDIINIVEGEFQAMPSFYDSDIKNENLFDVESVLSKAAGNVTTKLILGDVIDNEILDEWLSKFLSFQYALKSPFNNDAQVTRKLFTLIKEMPHVKNIDKIITSPNLTKEDLIKELVCATVFNAYGGISNLIISSLICFLRLTDKEKDKLVSESTNFLTSEEKTFEKQAALHSFFLEVIRMYPAAPAVYRRPLKDCVVQSTCGRFQLKKDELVTCKLLSMHRDPELLENPDKISLARNTKIIEDNNYTFGGKFTQAATPSNFKCPGQSISINIIKIFIVFFTKCDITYYGNLTYTGKNSSRLCASDEPLKVKTFSYNHSTNPKIQSHKKNIAAKF